MLKPIMSWTNRLKIWQKLTLIVVIMGLAIPAAIFVFLSQINSSIDAARRELAGVEYAAATIPLANAVTQHRNVAGAYLGGDRSQQDSLYQANEEVDTRLARVEALDREYSGTLKSAQRFTEIKLKWQNLETNLSKLEPGRSAEQHSQLLNAVAEHTEAVVDRSNLVADPDLDASYLARAALLRLPEATAHLNSLRSFGAALAGAQGKTNDEQLRLVALLGRARASLDGFKKDLDSAVRYNPSLDGIVGRNFAGFTAEAEDFLKLTEERLAKSTIDVTPADYNAAGFKTQEKVTALYEQSLGALRTRLQNRLDSLTDMRLWVFAGIAIVLGLTVLVVAGIARNLTNQVHSMSELLTKVTEVRYETQAHATTHTGGNTGELVAPTGFEINFDEQLSIVQSSEERDRLQQSITRLLDSVSQAAKGDLTGSLAVEDEAMDETTSVLADYYNQLVADMRGIVAEVQKATAQVGAATYSMQMTTDHLAQGADFQTSQIMEITRALQSMTESVKGVSESASRLALVAEQGRQTAMRGDQVVARTLDGMTVIKEGMKETAEKIKRLGRSSEEIGEIVQLISGIAKRTSILALNASIEAAMAGEAGLGFAVVAKDVEHLAVRSSEATKKVGEQIKAVQSDIYEVVASIEQASREVSVEFSLAKEASDALRQIQQVSNQLSELILSISVSAKQQAQGSEHLAKSMTQISTITQQTTQGAKEVAYSVNELAALAQSLKTSVSAFKIDANGNGLHA